MTIEHRTILRLRKPKKKVPTAIKLRGGGGEGLKSETNFSRLSGYNGPTFYEKENSLISLLIPSLVSGEPYVNNVDMRVSCLLAICEVMNLHLHNVTE